MLRDRFLEPGRAGDEAGFVELSETDHRVGLVEVGAALAHEGDLAPVHLAAGEDDAVHGPVGGQRLRTGFGRVDRVRRPALGPDQLFHRLALAAVDVVELVAAEHLGEGVDVVGGRRRRAPGVVATVAELDVEVDPGESGATGVDAGAVQVLLHQDLGNEVADLRAHHRDRMPGRRVLGRDQLPVGGVAAFAQAALDRGAKAAAAPDAPTRSSGDRGFANRAADRAAPGHVWQRRCASRRGSAWRSSSALRGRSSNGTRARRCGPPWLRSGRRSLHGQRRVQLVAAAAAEDAADQRGNRDDVGRLPRFDRLVQQRVLARPQCRVGARRGDVGVDPVDIALHVFDRLLAGWPVALRQPASSCFCRSASV